MPPEVHEGVPEEQVQITRHGRVIRPPVRFQDYVMNQALQHIDQEVKTWEDTEHVPHEIPNMPTIDEGPCDHLLAMKAVSDPDTMYLHQAMKEKDWPKFREAMQKEVDDHSRSDNWELIHKSKVPEGAIVLPGVWSVKRKRRISTREVYKWKARLTIDGSKQIHGKHYDETYSPVVTWPANRFFLVQALINK
jgi:hypothetical protein